MQGANDYSRFEYPLVISTLQLGGDLEKPKVTRKDWNVMPKPFQQELDCRQAQTVNCRLCQATMDVSNHLEDFTIACPYCKEATAIKNAPVGCRYVTCTCNALLVVDNKMQEAVCPRVSCNKIIQLPTNQGTSYGVVCSKCQYFFLHCIEPCYYSYATCPKCRTVQRPLHQERSNVQQNVRRDEDDDDDRHSTACTLICICIMIGLFVALCAYVISLEFVYSLRVGFLAFLIFLLVFSLCACL